MTDHSPSTGQPQKTQHSGTIYCYEPNPAKRAALLALFARIKARLALEQGNISDDNDVAENHGPT